MDKKIDQQIEMMKSLALSICILQNVVGTSRGNLGLAATLVAPGSAPLSRSALFQRFD